MKYGSIEAGGTKFVCAVANDNLEILERISFPTTEPKETIKNVIDFFKKNPVNAIGVGAFGPIELDKNSSNYGTILNTPKVGWKNFNYLKGLEALKTPIYITTDVNAAAYGEYVYDNEIKSCTYFTIGTGVGAGFVLNGEIINGVHHPEMGHMVIKKHPKDNYEGYCIYHKDCLEGLASGPSIEARTNIEGSLLPQDHEIFDYLAYYLAQAALNITLIQAPEKIIFGGGVSKNKTLIKKTRKEFLKLLNGYIEINDVNNYITTPRLGDNAGSFGCLAYAKEQFNQ